ncbi:MAG: hypothetical protein U0930_15225, partial [Pirellulales bacterium]
DLYDDVRCSRYEDAFKRLGLFALEGYAAGKAIKFLGKALDPLRETPAAKEFGRFLRDEAGSGPGLPDYLLGPSGKPKIHKVNHPSLKRSEDAARQRAGKNGSIEKHASPSKGEPHNHGVRQDGTKVGVHDNYPRNR